jgi:hypothetical protein
MAADAAWVIATVIAAADKAIRIDIEETPKGKEGKQKADGKADGKEGTNQRGNRTYLNDERYADSRSMPPINAGASNRLKIAKDPCMLLWSAVSRMNSGCRPIHGASVTMREGTIEK